MNLIAFVRRRYKVLVPVIAFLAVIALFFFFRSRANAQETNVYTTEPVALGDLTATVGATGVVRANQSATLVWKTSGVVAQVHIGLGNDVETGAVLGALDETSLPQSVILAQADLVSAKKALEDLLDSSTDQAEAAIALREAEEAYEDAKEYRESLNGRVEYEVIKYVVMQTPLGPRKMPRLKTVKYYPSEDEKAIADEKLALAEAKLKDAKRTYERLKDGPNPDDVLAAQARLNAAQAAIDQAKIVAPFAGTVTEVETMVGDVVNAGQEAFRLDDLSRLLVDVDISEVDINLIKRGQPATLIFDAVSGKVYHGLVVEVGSVGKSANGAVNFTVTVELTDADAQVRPGMTAAVEIQVIDLQDALLVPNRSVRVVNGQQVVYILKDNQVIPIKVKLGASSDAYSQVTDGDLQVGDLIILNPPAVTAQFGAGGGGRPGGGMPIFRP